MVKALSHLVLVFSLVGILISIFHGNIPVFLVCCACGLIASFVLFWKTFIVDRLKSETATEEIPETYKYEYKKRNDKVTSKISVSGNNITIGNANNVGSGNVSIGGGITGSIIQSGGAYNIKIVGNVSGSISSVSRNGNSLVTINNKVIVDTKNDIYNTENFNIEKKTALV